jgi:hypothetical protein
MHWTTTSVLSQPCPACNASFSHEDGCVRPLQNLNQKALTPQQSRLFAVALRINSTLLEDAKKERAKQLHHTQQQQSS